MVEKSKNPDYILMATTILLLIFGIIVLASASTPISQSKFGSSYYLLRHQLLIALVPGILVMILLFKIPLNFFKKKASLFLLINLILMMLVFLPQIGMKVGKAARWISIGSLSFQPSEILKLVFVLYLASWLETRNKKTSLSSTFRKNFSENLIAFLVIIGLVAVILVFQSDISTLGVIMASAVLVYFFAKTPLWHTLLIGVLGIASLFALINFASYRSERISVFLNPEIDPMGIGYQIKQSLIAVGSGGTWGLGFGMSQQKFGLLPHPISDSIFAILAEEAGMVGASILIFLFLLFLWRGYRIGKRSQNMFSRLTALGITSWILIQAFINIGSMIGILPLTGIPLPFISYGGSALITELGAVGILLNISRS